MIQRHHQIGTYQIEIDQSKNLLPMTKTIEFRDYVLIHLVATQSYYGLTLLLDLSLKLKFIFPFDKILLRIYKCKYIILSINRGEFKHEVRQFQKPYDNQQAEQTSLMV